MASSDFGIDLGSSNIRVCQKGAGICYNEPAIVAVDERSGEIIRSGKRAYSIIGRTPDYIKTIYPLQQGVICDFKLAIELLTIAMHKVCKNKMLRPRVAICVPSSSTMVEAKAVAEAVIAAGARGAYLVEEPLAAALGAGMDIMKPRGQMVIDIGGGTTDIAILSLGGVVGKASIKYGGSFFDESVAKYIRSAYNLKIGEKTAELVKIKIGSIFMERGDENPEITVKGINILSGLPGKARIKRSEIALVISEAYEKVLPDIFLTLEQMPPELIADIYDEGVVVTGGSAMLPGMDKFITKFFRTNARIAKNPINCVVKGTVDTFKYIYELQMGYFGPQNK